VMVTKVSERSVGHLRECDRV